MAKRLYILTGCSKGLGKALLESLLSESDVQVIGISRTAMENANNFRHVQVDLGDMDNLTERLDEIFPKGNFDEAVMINNAGWIGEIAPVGKLTHQGIAKVQMINVVAPGILMNEYVRRFAHQNIKKTVVNISSGAAAKDIDGWSGYASSKAALNRMTGIAQEESDLYGYHIQYYALSPGVIDTPMQADIRSTASEDFSNVDKFKAYKENSELSSPEETAEKVLYLIHNTDQFREVLQDVRKF